MSNSFLKSSARLKALHGHKTIIRSSSWYSQMFDRISRSKIAALATVRNRDTLASVQNSRCMGTGKSNEKFLCLDNINPHFVEMEYAVRGPLAVRTLEIEREMAAGVQKPFPEVTRTNLGDAQSLGQKPITYVRQLLAMVVRPNLLESNDFPEDLKNRAREILCACNGKSIGAYTDSNGIPLIRQQVAKYIENRDCGVPADWNKIILTPGATPAIKTVLALLTTNMDGKKSGIMIPIPQYPLYTATLAEYGLQKIGYFLDEDRNWALETTELQRSYDEAKECCNIRAIVVINPGNPTGQVLTRENIEEIVKFAHKNRLVIMADEVYQENIHDPNSKFYSFKRVMHEMGSPYREMELFSFMSASKGYISECGIRGGYMELTNISPDVTHNMLKTVLVQISPTTIGQTVMSAYVNPPQPGEPSYELYQKERKCIADSLVERAELFYKTLNTFEGYRVNAIQGALYSFPRIEIPPKAIEAAKAKNMPADTFYAFELLEATGICIISGTGFGQQPGTYHFRSTILLETEKLKVVMQKFKEFHANFMQQYK